MRGFRTASMVLAFAVVGTTLGAAQTVVITVKDSSTGLPVEGAIAELAASNGVVLARGTGDGGGTISLRGSPRNGQWVTVRRIGYRSLDLGPFNLRAGMDTAVAVQLVPSPVELEGVRAVAEAQQPYLRGRGFYERREAGVGHFLDPAAVQKILPKAKVVADLIDVIPGVDVTQSSAGRVPRLRSCRTVQIDRSAPGGGDKNLPKLYVDGTPVGAQELTALHPGDVMAVEVYIGPATVPLIYGGSDTPCGVILIWTRH